MTRTALLVIDVQESFRARPSWSEVADPDLAARLVPLVRASRARGDLVLWVLHTEPGTGDVFDPESGHVTVMAPLVPARDEPVLLKTVHNAFTSTDLERRLRTAGVERVRLVGIRTEQCVETTARVASDLGFEVRFVLDGTTTQPIGTLGAAAIIERTAAVLGGRFVELESMHDAIAEDSPESDTGSATVGPS